ncbi:short chain dehydrogenase [Paraburkholderia sp. Ac-20347]|uniref:short chain dehydrogenase n=1 Tax=Paraburkholderia sp. Ac-20347 TaxID=2703892 RepID=UPI0019825EB5|nr:short chain dehydrogenase [Paraburkholderia sp. Ac-20347]MBN3809719.1 short chain dehydrogenase [Paraburkholderia sp. Ac-20347]
MKILLVGASGAVGGAIAQTLGETHTIVPVGRTSGAYRTDLTDDASVTALFREVGTVDAIVSATGHVHFGPLADMSAAQFDIGLQDKLLGQVRLALIGQHYLSDGGSITLTSGIIAEEPIAQGANATAVNCAIEGFVCAAATELRGNRRINVVSPTVLTESLERFAGFFPGFESVPAQRVALAYQRSVEGVQTGRVYRVW